jgi:hypothetical protein
LPGLTDQPSQGRTLADYINVLYRLSIGIGAFIAVIQITLAGIKYMSTDAFSSKEQAKKDITAALLGLLIMLSTVVILNLIYPRILEINVLQGLAPVKVLPAPTPVLPKGTPIVSQAALDAFAEKNPGKKASSGTFIASDVSLEKQNAIRESFRQGCNGEVVSQNTYGTNFLTRYLPQGLVLFCVEKAPVSAPAPSAI